MQKSSGVALLAIVTTAILSTACSSNPTPAGAAEPVAATPATPAVNAGQGVPSSADAIASGPIVVENQIEVAAQRDGILAAVLVETGSSVKKGQLLAKLDDRQLTADRDAAAAKLRSLEADLKNWEAGAQVARAERDRAEEMWKANIIAKAQEEKAKYQYDATQFEVERQREDVKYAQQTLRSLELELEKTRITAPFDGVVARRYIRLGQEVAKKDHLFWISAMAPLRVKFSLPESYLDRVRRGTELSVVSSLSPGEVHGARVVLVSPVVDPSSDTIDVTAELEGSTHLRPGMTVNIRLRNPQ